jgi:lipopolysaccharide biosynthesis glycosyltransferase
VLILNIQKINEMYTEKQLLDLAVSKKWTQYDQDLLNFICKDDVKIIDAEWNFVEDIDHVYHSLPKNLLEEYERSEKSPKIIHYSGNRKPWINLSSKYNKHFWTYAEKTAYSSIIKHMKTLDN